MQTATKLQGLTVRVRKSPSSNASRQSSGGALFIFMRRRCGLI